MLRATAKGQSRPDDRRGRIFKQGSPSARWALVEAAWSVVRQPGPLHAFYERIRARRGNKIAVAACARKLAALFWSLLPARWREREHVLAVDDLVLVWLGREGALIARSATKLIRGMPAAQPAVSSRRRKAGRRVGEATGCGRDLA